MQLCLCFPPGLKTVTLLDTATVQDLVDKVHQVFGNDEQPLQFTFGFPPTVFVGTGSKVVSMTLTAVGLQHKDRVRIASYKPPTSAGSKHSCSSTAKAPPPRAATAHQSKPAAAIPNPYKRNNNNNNNNNNSNSTKINSTCIPGLTLQHFTKSSNQVAPTPKLISSSSSSTTTPTIFALQWTAAGSQNGTVYHLSARGTAHQPTTWQVHCDCPAFAKRGEARTRRGKELLWSVCKHLHAALVSVVDPNAVATAGSSPKHHDDDDDDKSDNEVAPHIPRTKKRRLVSTTHHAGTVCEAPIKLFANVADMVKRRTASRTDPCFTQCLTLAEMVFGRNTSNASLQWMVLSNFLVDFSNIIAEMPQLLCVPRLVLFHSVKEKQVWPANPGQQVDIIRLNPSDDPQTTSNPLKYRFMYGSHHTKMFLVGYQDKIRVVVSTGNLLPVDANKSNAAYVEEFPLKTADEYGTTTSDFEETLVLYMQSYGYRKKGQWMGPGQKESLLQVLRRYDYSQARGVLIPSIPGYHNIDDQTPRMGQLKLRQAIQRYTMPAKEPRPIVMQFTSIGTTSEAYLRTLQTSMDTCLAAACGGKENLKNMPLSLRLVYPTAREIRESIEGYVGGGTVPGSQKNVSKAHLQNLWYKWTSQSGSNPLATPRIVPHIKSYYQVSGDGFDWLCITSHNISQPAWGTIRENKKYGGQHLYIASWELGVFVSPQTLGVDRLVPYGADTTTDGTSVATVPMPFCTHALERYTPTDEPWAWDKVYTVPDAYGQRQC